MCAEAVALRARLRSRMHHVRDASANATVPRRTPAELTALFTHHRSLIDLNGCTDEISAIATVNLEIQLLRR